MYPCGGVAVFNLGIFLARYPEFSNVDPAKLQEYFNEAGLYLSNTPTSPVQDVNRRLTLLNMLVAHISFLAGDLNAAGATTPASTEDISVSSPNAGNFTIAHGLGVAPSSIAILATSLGEIAQQAPPDAINLYLQATDVGVTAIITMTIAAQGTSSGGPARPVGRVESATEGSVSASLGYGSGATPGTGEWFVQSAYGASFWQATVSLRGFRYRARPTNPNQGQVGYFPTRFFRP